MTREQKDRRNARSRQRYREFLAEGRCPLCSGAHPVIPGKKSCESCRSYYNKLSEIQRKTGSPWKARYRKKILDGKCPRCGASTDGIHSYCPECREKARIYEAKRWKEKRNGKDQPAGD